MEPVKGQLVHAPYPISVCFESCTPTRIISLRLSPSSHRPISSSAEECPITPKRGGLTDQQRSNPRAVLQMQARGHTNGSGLRNNGVKTCVKFCEPITELLHKPCSTPHLHVVVRIERPKNARNILTILRHCTSWFDLSNLL